MTLINPQKLAEATLSADEGALETEKISQSLQMLAGQADKDGALQHEGENTQKAVTKNNLRLLLKIIVSAETAQRAHRTRNVNIRFSVLQRWAKKVALRLREFSAWPSLALA